MYICLSMYIYIGECVMKLQTTLEIQFADVSELMKRRRGNESEFNSYN